MPTVLRLNGFRFVIYQLADVASRGGRQEHLPAHVHVMKAGGEVVIDIATRIVRDDTNMSRADIRKATRLVADNEELLIEKWRQYNG